MQFDRRKILLAAIAVPLVSCSSGVISDSNNQPKNPIGNPTPAEVEDWSEFISTLEMDLIKNVDLTIAKVSRFETELRAIRAHHADHLQIFNSKEITDEAIFNSEVGSSNFSELANLRIKHSRNINLIKNSIKKVTDPALITTFTQIAACDTQVVNLLADLMLQVAQTPEVPAVSSG
jgi:hypothetical protein